MYFYTELETNSQNIYKKQLQFKKKSGFLNLTFLNDRRVILLTIWNKTHGKWTIHEYDLF